MPETATLSDVAVAALVTAMVAEQKQTHTYILVVGLGLTGLSVVRHLREHGHSVVVVDSRAQPPGLEQLQQDMPDVQVFCGPFNEALFMGAQQLVVSPGVPMQEPAIVHAIQQGVEAIGDIELFAREVNAPVIAITGSNGKSTVTTLVGEMARRAGIKVAVGGNIGTPALDLLHEQAELYVLELSSFQLETLHSLQPIAATVLNVSEDHMDRYDNVEHYAFVKQQIYQHCKTAVINRDDMRVSTMDRGLKSISGFTLGEPAMGDFGLRDFGGEMWLCRGGKQLIAERELKLGGRHNTANALAALALGEAAGIDLNAMLETLRCFTGLPHRTQWVCEHDSVNWYNDSKGTNVGATIAAIEGLQVDNKLILIAGGLGKGADFSPLRDAVKDKVRLVVLIGEDAVKIEQALQQIVPVMLANSMQEAVQIAADLAHPGDSVLLSPACASFDMFKGYEHRGEMFMDAVRALP